MKYLRLLSIVCVIVCLTLLSGCSKKEDEPNAEPNTDTESSAQVSTERSIKESPKEESTTMLSSESTLFQDVLALWETNQKDEAVKQFLSIQWDNPSVFQGIEALNMTEQELGSLPLDEVKPIAGEALNLSRKMRNLVFYVVETGDKHISSGDIKAAKEHFEAIRLFGEALLQSDRIELIKMVSKAIVSLGQKKLSEIE
ncbi:MAG: hypothetical protein JSW47_22625 [Phycisphaerales bacterium]|nr:MAG: hypothetical protein JSW47_22625 [Phycisphaerales bacterium]